MAARPRRSPRVREIQRQELLGWSSSHKRRAAEAGVRLCGPSKGGTLHLCRVYRPISLPGLALVRVEGLLPVALGGGLHLPDEPHEYWPSAYLLVIVEFTTSIREVTDSRRHGEGAGFAVRPINAPFVRVRIVKPDCHSFDMARRTIRLELVHIGASIPQLPRHGGATELHPLLRSGKRVHQAAVMKTPFAYVEIEVVLSIVLSISMRNLRCHHAA